VFWDLGAVGLRLDEHEAFGIYQQMALPTIDLFPAIVSAFLTAYPGGLQTDWESTMPALG
jgi:hypothetical protein